MSKIAHGEISSEDFIKSGWQFFGNRWHHLKWGTTTITSENTSLKMAHSDYMVIMHSHCRMGKGYGQIISQNR